MKIVKLTASNIKRLTAIEITPEGNLITIGGKNKQGKSSVIDSIAYALGGKALIPSEPIRKGEDSAEIEVSLGDIIVTRKFRRDRLACDCAGPDIEVKAHTKTCSWNKFGETKSTLLVRSKEGLQYPSPQAVLDKLLGQLTFDPLDFVNSRDSTKQAAMLRKIVNLDTRELDRERLEIYQERTLVHRQLTAANVKLAEMPSYPNTGFNRLSTAALFAELERADKVQNKLQALTQDVHDLVLEIRGDENALTDREKRIRELEEQVKLVKESVKATQKALTGRKAKLEQIKTEIAALPEVDRTAIHSRLVQLEELNSQVDANVAEKKQKDEVERLRKESEAKSDAIAVIDETKKKMIESIQFPVEGLGFDFEKDEVIFNGLPFDQASQAEQLRVSVAIGLAVNSGLKVLLIKDGSTLDSEGMRLIAEIAEKADAQLWVERVAESKEGIAVMIEDGAIV